MPRPLFPGLKRAYFGAAALFAFGLVVAPVPQADAAGSSSPTPSTSGGAANNSVDVNAEYKKGVKAIADEQWADAESAFKKVVKARSKDGEARAYLGVAQYNQEDYKNAKKNLEKAIKYNTILPTAWEHLGKTLLAEGDTDGANEQLQALADMKANCAEPCDMGDDIQAAHDGLQTAINGDEVDPQASLLTPNSTVADRDYASAVKLINEERYEDAIFQLMALNAQQPTNADVLNYLGFSHRKLGKYDDAIEYYQAALTINPDHAGANEYLGELYVELGQLDMAQTQLATLDRICTFACAEYDDLKVLVDDLKARQES